MNPSYLHPFALELTDQGISNFAPQEEWKPRGWGYSVIKIDNTQAADYTFNLAGDATGSEGAASHFEARVVIMEPGGPRYETVTIADNLNGSKTVSLTAADSQVFLVVMAVPDHFTGFQNYGFTLDVIRN